MDYRDKRMEWSLRRGIHSSRFRRVSLGSAFRFRLSDLLDRGDDDSLSGWLGFGGNARHQTGHIPSRARNRLRSDYRRVNVQILKLSCAQAAASDSHCDVACHTVRRCSVRDIPAYPFGVSSPLLLPGVRWSCRCWSGLLFSVMLPCILVHRHGGRLSHVE
jgi:hypothetical protein